MPSVALTLLCAVAVASDAGGNGGTSPGLRGASLPVNESMQDKRENEEGGTCCFSGEDKDICATCYPMSIASYKSKCSKKNECDLNGVGSVFFPSVFCLNLEVFVAFVLRWALWWHLVSIEMCHWSC